MGLRRRRPGRPEDLPVTYAPYPFVDTDAELDVRFEPDRIVLTDPDGLEVAYPESYYALD